MPDRVNISVRYENGQFRQRIRVFVNKFGFGTDLDMQTKYLQILPIQRPKYSGLKISKV